MCFDNNKGLILGPWTFLKGLFVVFVNNIGGMCHTCIFQCVVMFPFAIYASYRPDGFNSSLRKKSCLWDPGCPGKCCATKSVVSVTCDSVLLLKEKCHKYNFPFFLSKKRIMKEQAVNKKQTETSLSREIYRPAITLFNFHTLKQSYPIKNKISLK